MTKREVLARKLIQRALSGDKDAQVIVIERVEGKAGKAADPKIGDDLLESTIDEAGVAALNQFTRKKLEQT